MRLVRRILQQGEHGGRDEVGQGRPEAAGLVQGFLDEPRRAGGGGSEMEIPSRSGGPQRHQRPSPILPRRRTWSFRAVAELHATHDRGRFVNDDGASALSANSTPPATGTGS